MGLEPKTQGIPIQPTAHYAMGGIPTNIDGEVIVDADGTVFPGLYAAGECACVSVHGANRLGTNSLLDIVVFGKRGGRSMAEFVKTAERVPLPDGAADDVRERIDRIFASTGTEKAATIRSELQDHMMDKASVFRTEESLSEMITVLDDLKARVEHVGIDDKGEIYNYDITEALELGYLVDLAEAVVVSARARTESRGAHWRDDHPIRDDASWMKHTMVTRQPDGSVTLEYKPVDGDLYVPMERKY
jgi:succinate dehydrogenase / fumarate reductase flavoprotein subunit